MIKWPSKATDGRSGRRLMGPSGPEAVTSSEQMFQLTVQHRRDRTTHDIAASQSTRLVSEVLRDLKLSLNTRCGQRGLCDGCIIDLISGALIQTASGDVIQADGTAQRIRGCEYKIPTTGAAEIHVPVRSLLAHRPQIVTSFRLNVARAHDPLWQCVRIEPGDVNQNPPTPDTLCHAIAEQDDRSLPIIASHELRNAAFLPDEVLHLQMTYQGQSWLLDQRRSRKRGYGAAIDIGTTTVVVVLVDLDNGDVVASASALNAQSQVGDNVLTRINKCMVDETMTKRMQEAIVRETLAPLIGQAVRSAQIELEQLVCLVIAGNTTMLHLLVAENPATMGVAPFTPTFLDYRLLKGCDLELVVPSADEPDDRSTDEPDSVSVSPCGELSAASIHLLPGAAAYVGADITAGVLASGMAYRDDTCLLVDLGTNGEIVLRHEDVLVGCATAAGPAFEGAGLTCGVRAGKGAIGHVWLEADSFRATTEVIEGGAPIGLCGTAYVDFVARAHRVGFISSTGRFTPQAHDGYLEKQERYGWGLTIAQTRSGEPIYISEADIASLLQAKAAIAAGIACLLRRLELRAEQVNKVYVAGGFGFHMHVDSLLGCGLLPGFAAEQVELIGNTSLAGAYLTLLDSGAMDEIQRLSRRIEIVELNLDPQFEMTYIDQLALPRSWPSQSDHP
jgi:uncharacterized 2Fe-2S/4Fe-4S cluster protein (DUF4445 family)